MLQQLKEMIMMPLSHLRKHNQKTPKSNQTRPKQFRYVNAQRRDLQI